MEAFGMETLKFAPPPKRQGESSKLRIVRDPSIRIRQAVRGVSRASSGITLADTGVDNNVPLLSRLQANNDLRNVDTNRLTSLSWAAIEGSLEVFEWLLLDYGHDDHELSRVSHNPTSRTSRQLLDEANHQVG
jgi:hypothetical protein